MCCIQQTYKESIGLSILLYIGLPIYIVDKQKFIISNGKVGLERNYLGCPVDYDGSLGQEWEEGRRRRREDSPGQPHSSVVNSPDLFVSWCS